ncbi:MAG: TonB-dependent receptor [Bacteroidales bacterium]|nr:TonB-dependent receptor [Bacteroidales bacterium]
MARKKIIGLIVTLLATLGVNGQYSCDTLRSIEGVEVSSQRLLENATGKSVQHIPAKAIDLNQGGTLNELLLSQSSVNIRSYGNAGTTSISIRGTSNDHVAVMWNGLKISSPTTGEMNLFFLSSFMVDEMSIQKGASSALYGSGAIGGSIHLNSQADHTPGLTTSMLLKSGSFDNYLGAVRLNYSNKIYSGKLRILYNQSDNDYSFKNRTKRGKPTEYIHNSAFKRTSVNQENYFQINKNHKLSLFLNVDDVFYESIPTMFVKNKQAFIKNKDMRSAVVWNYQQKNIQINARSGVFLGVMDYNDSISKVFSQHKYFTSNSELETKFILKSGLLLVGVNNIYNECRSTNYNDNPSQGRISIFSGYRHIFSDYFKANINLREEIVNAKAVNPTFSFGAEFRPGKIRFKGNISQSYRVPDFNDLFWIGPGAIGNPDLLPEYGWSSDFGMGYANKADSYKMDAQLTAFASQTKNLIQWNLIGQDWRPVNVQKVDIKGLEADFSASFSLRKAQVNGAINYTYTIATRNKLLLEQNDPLIDKQLAYRPKHQINSNLSVNFESLEFGLTNNYVGERFADNLNTASLESYLLLDLYMRHRVQFQRFEYTITGRINNLLDEDYEQVIYYAMPGRNFNISLLFKLKQNKK